MKTYTCAHCAFTTENKRALSGHSRMHGPSSGTIKPIFCSCILTKKKMPYQYLHRYQQALIPCKQCGDVFRPSIAKTTFCGRSCAATYTNGTRQPRSKESRNKTSDSLIIFNEKESSKSPTKKYIVGPFSTIIHCKCAHCGIISLKRKRQKYCDKCYSLYSPEYRTKYKFTFNVYQYPDLFDLPELARIGFYSRGGTAGEWNPDGLSRDHKISVNSAIKNNYDSFYITHPLNCELMPWVENNKKRSNDSIIYSDLVLLVDAYEYIRTNNG